MTDDRQNDRFSFLKELVGKPIENVSQLGEFVRAFNKAGVEVSCGTSLFRCFTVNGEEHILIGCCAGLDSESWNRRGTTIKCEKDEHDGFIYRLSESSGWCFQFSFSLNCVVTNIQWDADEEDYDELPTIVLSRFYMPIADLLDEQKRRAMIVKSLETNYDAEIESIGQVFAGPSKKIHVVHPDYDEECDLAETFVNNRAMERHAEDEDSRS